MGPEANKAEEEEEAVVVGLIACTLNGWRRWGEGSRTYVVDDSSLLPPPPPQSAASQAHATLMRGATKDSTISAKF